MTREETIREACSIVALAYRSIGDYSHASDGFCGDCTALHGVGWHYENQGQALDYVRSAVVARLLADGHSIHPAWDGDGREIRDE